MPPPNETQVIGVLRSHLQEIYSALDAALGQNEAKDLADGYRNGRSSVQTSWLTKSLQSSHRHVEGYLDVEIEENKDDE